MRYSRFEALMNMFEESSFCLGKTIINSALSLTCVENGLRGMNVFRLDRR